MIETLLKELTEALRENTAALTQSQADRNNAAPVKKTKKAKAAPVPEPTPAPVEEPEPEPTAEETTTPTKVAPGSKTPTKPVDDTPHVAGVQHPGQPPAGEHVDVDEVIAQINSIVKSKLQESPENVETVKNKWSSIRQGYGVDRISDLRNDPASLLKALDAAKAL